MISNKFIKLTQIHVCNGDDETHDYSNGLRDKLDKQCSSPRQRTNQMIMKIVLTLNTKFERYTGSST